MIHPQLCRAAFSAAWRSCATWAGDERANGVKGSLHWCSALLTQTLLPVSSTRSQLVASVLSVT